MWPRHARPIAAAVLWLLLLSACGDDSISAAGADAAATGDGDDAAEDVDAATVGAAGSPQEMGMLQIQVGDLLFDARVAGPADGEPVILLHGFPQTSYSYRHQLRALADAGYRAVAPDQRGYSPGARPPAVEDYTLDKLVQDVIDIADAQGFARFHLVGHDWGSAVAWYLAGAYPDRLASLTTLSVPHPLAFADALNDPDSEQTAMSSYMSYFRSEGSEDEITAGGAAQLRTFYEGVPEEDVDVYVEALGTPDALRGGLNWYRANDFAQPPAPGPITMPAMYVWSDQDTALGRDGAEGTTAYVEGPYRFEIIEGVNHWIPDNAPEQLNTLLLDHVAAYPL